MKKMVLKKTVIPLAVALCLGRPGVLSWSHAYLLEIIVFTAPAWRYAAWSNFMVITHGVSKMTKERDVWDIIIGIVPIFISLATAYLTYTLSVKQTMISKLEYAPIFILKNSFDYDEQNKIYHTERLSVYNEGYPIQNFKKEAKSYVTLTYSTNKDKRQIVVPLSYYWVNYTATGGKGKLTELVGLNNNSHAFNLSNEALDYNAQHPDVIVLIDISTTLELSYTEVDGEVKKAFYVNRELTSENEFRKLGNEALKIPPFNIETVKLDDLLSLLNQPH
ncbi:hypothetical protein [Kosakonia oryzae]|uniref:Uncharacterized protein n=2 Tax=Kosakonia oryzae TaxID=497725 RepID=A0ABM6BXI3_9ENTR|nr:hypothetical protein [Kosakonia oryzae]ANI82942.2 hypothetical protein AWR26_12530 [Kosakonia oryzae]